MNRTRTFTKSNNTTTANTQRRTNNKAKNADNQEALDRLQEHRQRAIEKANSYHMELALQRAIKSLQQCPHPIKTRAQACELKNVGPRLAMFIVPKEPTSVGEPPVTSTGPTPAASAPPPNKPSRKRPAAAVATGTVGILSTSAATTTASATATANNSTHRNHHHFPGDNPKEKAYQQARQFAEQLQLPTGPWKVVLLVDIREHKSKQVVARIRQSGIPCEERHLPIGDMLWIAKCRSYEILLGTIIERKEFDDLRSSIFGTRYMEQRLRLKHSGLPQVLYLVEGKVLPQNGFPIEAIQTAIMETRIHMGFSVVQTDHLQHTVLTLKGLHRRILQRTFPEAFGPAVNLPTFDAVEARRQKRVRRPTSLLEMVFDTPPVLFGKQTRFMTYAELKTKIERDRHAGTCTVGAISTAMYKQIPTLSDAKCTAVAQAYPTLTSLVQAYHVRRGDGSITNHNPDSLLVDLPCGPRGNRRMGPISASKLALACAVQRDGTMVTPAPGVARLPVQTPPSSTMPTESTVAAAATTTTTKTPSSTARIPSVSSVRTSTLATASFVDKDTPSTTSSPTPTPPSPPSPPSPAMELLEGSDHTPLSSPSFPNPSQDSAVTNRQQDHCYDLTQDSPVSRRSASPSPAKQPALASTGTQESTSTSSTVDSTRNVAFAKGNLSSQARSNLWWSALESDDDDDDDDDDEKHIPASVSKSTTTTTIQTDPRKNDEWNDKENTPPTEFSHNKKLPGRGRLDASFSSDDDSASLEFVEQEESTMQYETPVAPPQPAAVAGRNGPFSADSASTIPFASPPMMEEETGKQPSKQEADQAAAAGRAGPPPDVSIVVIDSSDDDDDEEEENTSLPVVDLIDIL